jgi:hypothetical protein
MSGLHVLRLLKHSRHAGICGHCQQRITWAVCAPRGKSVPLIAAPIVLWEERTDRDVVFEVVGGDQVHKCPVPAVKAAHAKAPGSPRRRGPKKQPVFAGFSRDRMQQLRDAVEHGTKPSDPSDGGLLF